MPEFQISMAAARVNAELNQQEMADRLGIDRTSYIRYEKGESIIRMDTAFRFAEIVNIPFQYIRFYLPKNTT